MAPSSSRSPATDCNSICSLSCSISSRWPRAQLYSWPRLDDITLGAFWGLLGLRGGPRAYRDMSALCVNQALPWVIPVRARTEERLPAYRLGSFSCNECTQKLSLWVNFINVIKVFVYLMCDTQTNKNKMCFLLERSAQTFDTIALMKHIYLTCMQVEIYCISSQACSAAAVH